MARKSRYVSYYKGAIKVTKQKKSTPKSIRERLQELKKQEFVMSVPVGDDNE